MYINFWYPAAMSSEVTAEKPIRVDMLGQRMVLFRDAAGDAHCLHDVCIHRGGSLSGGKIMGNVVACPYHGWEYNGAGKCTRAPSLGMDAKPPSRAKVDSYPVQEKYGIVFAFLGDEPEATRPSLYEIEEFDDEAWRPNAVEVMEMPFYFERSMENGLDPAHNEFVHPTHGFSGRRTDYNVNPIEMKDTDWGSGFIYIFNAPKLEGVRSYEGDLEVGAWHWGPNTLITHIHITPEAWAHQYFFECPIDEQTTRIFFVNMRNFMLEEEHDAFVTDRNMAIAGEDKVVLSDIRPRLTPPTNNKESLVAADIPIAKFREVMSGWAGRGWKIDREAVLATWEDRVYAIPSPTRRTSKNWVIDAMPLVPGTSAEAARDAAE